MNSKLNIDNIKTAVPAKMIEIGIEPGNNEKNIRSYFNLSDCTICASDTGKHEKYS